MLALLEAEQSISDAQGRFEQLIRERATFSKRTDIGFPSGKMEADTCWLEPLDLWCAFEHAGNRYWNALGLGNPFKVNAPPPSLEINPPFSGINRRIAGGFVVDEARRIYLIHRGKVGGGRPGIGKEAFLRWYTGESKSMAGQRSLYGGKLTEISDGDRLTSVIVIGALDEPRFLDHLTRFVRCSREFRELAAADQLRP